MPPPHDLAHALAHVLWVCGAPDSGKTSVARALAEMYGLQVYHFDQFDRVAPPGHWSRATPERQPHMAATRLDDLDGRWVDTTPHALVERWNQTAPERFALTIEDLLALPTSPPIIAEGYGFTPDLVLPVISDQRQAIWLISTDDFKRSSYERRGKGAFAQTRDPQLARANHVQRDLLLAAQQRMRARELGLTVVDVDGAASLEQVVGLVTAHFELPPERYRDATPGVDRAG